MEQLICQSCGMPISVPELFGTNRSSERDSDYCHFCYQNGSFTADISMDEMINLCAGFVDDWKVPEGEKLTKEQAITLMKEHFPRLKRWAKRKATENEYHKAINRVIEYIDKHLAEPIDIGLLAGIANISSFHFHRIFRSIIGENTGEYIQRLRLEYAAQQLRMSRLNLEEIAAKTGYQTKHALSKAFKKHFSISPSGFRKNYETIQAKESTPCNAPSPKQSEKTFPDLFPEIRVIKDIRYIYIRIIDVYGNPSAYNVAWGKLLSFAQENNIVNKQTEYLGLCFDDPTITSPDRCRFYACITTDREIKPRGEFGIQTVKGGLYAIFTLKGTYSNLMGLYENIYLNWLPGSDYNLRNGIPFEKYLNSPEDVKKEELLTEIYIPVKLKNR